MVSEAIYRHEYKYPINAGDCEILRRRLGKVMRLDPHTGSEGTYMIRSLYFDNAYDKALFEKISGTNPRAKFRIRIYNGSDSVITLEKKVKAGELTQKLQAKITREECDKITSGDIDWMLKDGRGVVAELYAQMKGCALRPKVIVEYTRTPFIYDAGNVRVTLDCNIRSGVFSTDLFHPVSLVPTGDMDVLEIKYDRFLPDVVKMAVYPITYGRESMSKYEVCRKFG
ncbi:MAG: polyphosphate polymerase domain-containing protein [Eubacteriales bacterium]